MAFKPAPDATITITAGCIFGCSIVSQKIKLLFWRKCSSYVVMSPTEGADALFDYCGHVDPNSTHEDEEKRTAAANLSWKRKGSLWWIYSCGLMRSLLLWSCHWNFPSEEKYVGGGSRNGGLLRTNGSQKASERASVARPRNTGRKWRHSIHLYWCQSVHDRWSLVQRGFSCNPACPAAHLATQADGVFARVPSGWTLL